MTLMSTVVNQTRGLLVNELFGPTFQGEGPSAGQRALFVRLASCNLSCGWCDSRFSWDWTRYDPRAESHRESVPELARWVLERSAELVVITGGEPLLQQDGVLELVAALRDNGRRVEIETNGTIPPDERLTALVERFNVSPKLAHAGMTQAKRVDVAALRAFVACGKAVFKVVLSGLGDVAELAALQKAYGLEPVWVMPKATDESELLAGLRALAEPALDHGWHLTSRLHILLWGDERGR